jgi:Leucine-rich repeat (LRR) protein
MLLLALGGAALAAGYLAANWLDDPHAVLQDEPVNEGALRIDPEVLSRPGVAEICKLGGRVVIEDSSPAKPIIGVHLPNTLITDEGLTAVQGWSAVRVLDLSGTKVSDASLQMVHSLKELDSLYLSFTAIKGPGLKALAGLPQLRVLDLSKTAITESALESLRGVRNLEVLSLIDVPVTDEGLKHIASLPRLRRLDITGTQVTDRGLQHLNGLSELQLLGLNDTPTTEAGCDALKRQLANLKINTNH